MLFSESDVLDVQEDEGILRTLYKNLALQGNEVTFHHLELTEQHYLSGNWGDTISNSRNFLENVLREVARAHSLHCQGAELSDSVYTVAWKIRDYLQEQGLLEQKEKVTLKEVFGLLSETGSHPYIAEKDQARLMRHLALTFAQFVMLRYQGFLNAQGK
ncbi:hypothetical protein [Aggregatilinea lenta]|uniref:hypothetical protein n=1 Tax=Aggregatilinea lenta TaxID=913108 RepID=UPI000E5A41D9|nr:hypothetical protein [Aggregatilinea lenta]